MSERESQRERMCAGEREGHRERDREREREKQLKCLFLSPRGGGGVGGVETNGKMYFDQLGKVGACQKPNNNDNNESPTLWCALHWQ